MPAISFSDRLAAAVQAKRTPAIVGLDPRFESLPAGLQDGARGLAERAISYSSAWMPHMASREYAHQLTERAAGYARFCRDVIDVVASLVPAVKPQMAFFEELGPPGICALAEVIAYARERGLLVILDGKRGDIGSTAEAYARGLLGRDSPWGGDALTVNPYLGGDSLQPFVKVARERDAGVFVLVKTSNPGSRDFQDLDAGGRPLYQHVAEMVDTLARETLGSCGYGAIGAVVGATFPAQLAELRQAMPHAWLLIPGYGSQGGTAADVAPAFDSQGLGAVVNNSRGIIFAYHREPYRSRFGETRWQAAVEAALVEMIEQLRA